MNKNRNIFIACLISFSLGTFIGYKIFYQPIIIPVVEYRDKIINLNDSIKQQQVIIDTLYKDKIKLVIKEKLIIKQNEKEDSIILNTPDTNIIKLFSELSIKLSSSTRIK